ncbi:Mth938-like domain-containing protein [Candidatus Venteria ishoeyi]|uniref:Xcc1710-like domain-containing protein n=1 Tax=Candidatus Venteria ishoeyi TaxID=1899563 RepID=A0A1H6FDV8_9GAMM|nr:Mth938-like domain-containing protein [Candidatus Venteria ishoeyi]MDM8546956.1 Mth938-like domain-containing protein [Candidatus Venteria ishoeyi]SEH07346.1 Uncharacterised protein [Candidatus Venteria ishoeyi]
MNLQLDHNEAHYQIQAYQSQEYVKVNGEHHTQSLLVSPQRLEFWTPQQFEQLTPSHFSALLDWQAELLIFGSGSCFRYPPSHLLQALINARIGVEVMDTAAACRTYGLLAAEGRNVLAALLIV